LAEEKSQTLHCVGVAASDVFRKISDVLATNLMLTGLLFLFSMFTLFSDIS